MPFDGPPDKLDVEIQRLAEEPTAGLDPLAEVGLPDRKLAWKEAPGRLRADQVVSEAACGGQARPGEHLISSRAPDKRQLRGPAAFDPSTHGSFLAQGELEPRRNHALAVSPSGCSRHRCL